MSQIAIEDQISEFRDLITRVKDGDEIIITEGSNPVARLSPFQGSRTRRPGKRRFGTLRNHLIHMAEDFDAPLEDFAEYM